ncbi:MAG: hypothetical protein LH702_32940 [Phormidesmis sp. CAN_BIN44]|nr:hypothetical protein [Phormidesmis sp. CAN_BIN44]
MQDPAYETPWMVYKNHAYRVVGKPDEYRYEIKTVDKDETQSAETYDRVTTANTAARKAIDIVSAISFAAGNPFVTPDPELIPEPEVRAKRVRRTTKK